MSTSSPRLNEPPRPAPAEPGSCGCGARPSLPAGLNLFSGELVESVDDLRIAGRGIDFVWSRKYRSIIGRDGPVGHRWDFSNHLFVRASGDDLILGNGDNRDDVFKRQRDGTFRREEMFHIGRPNADGGIAFLFPDQGRWEFSPLDGRPEAGRIRSIVDRNGNALTFQYGEQGRLAAVVDTLGRPITVGYGADGRIATITDFASRQIRYEYYTAGEAGGSAGDLKSVTRPAVVGTPNGNDFPQGKKVTYTYLKGQSDERLNHLLVSITDASGRKAVENAYAVEQPQAFEFGRLLRQARAGNDVVVITYHPSSDGAAVSSAIVNDANGNVKEFLFDAAGRCAAYREYSGRAKPGQPVTRDANRPVRPLRASDPTFFETRYQWNADTLLTQVRHPNGATTERVYEAQLAPEGDPRLRGRLRLERMLPGPAGAEPNELVRQFAYAEGFGCTCAESFVAQEIDARGGTTVRDHDARGNVLRVRHRIDSIVEEFGYNEFGQVVRRVHPSHGEARQRVDTFQYDGLLARETTDAEGLALTTSYERDRLGRVVRIAGPRGHDRLTVWNALDQIVRDESPAVNASGVRYRNDRFYDATDNLVRQVADNRDETGMPRPDHPTWTTARTFDARNRCVLVEREVAPGRTLVVESAYDGNGNRVMMRRGKGAVEVRFAYDERDLLFREVRASGAALQSTKQIDYDGARNRVSVRIGLEGRPREFRSTYDGYGRLARTTDPEGTEMALVCDANGNVVNRSIDNRRAAAAGTAEPRLLASDEYRYDAMDRLVQTDAAWFDLDTQQPIGAGRASTRTEYNDCSQVTVRIDPAGAATRLRYDGAHRLIEVADAASVTRYGYDPDSNRTLVQEVETSGSGGRETRYGFDPIGRLTDESNPVRRYAYDSLDNLVRTTDALGNEVRIEYDGLRRPWRVGRAGEGIEIRQRWDDAGRLVERTDPNGNATRYGYDAAGRLASLGYADGTAISFTHDIHGNPTVRRDPNGTTVRSQYDLLNRVVRRTIEPGPGVAKTATFEAFAYDGLGRVARAANDQVTVSRSYDSLSRLLREEVDGHALKWTYDAAGQVVRREHSSGHAVSYAYDAARRLTRIDAEGATIAYDYAGKRVARRTSSAGVAALATQYEYDASGRVASIAHAGAGSAAPLRSSYARDAEGRKLVATVNADDFSERRAYRYDTAGRLRTTEVSSGTGPTGRHTKYALDKAGNRVRVDGGRWAGSYRMDAGPGPDDRRVNQYTQTPFDARVYDRNGNLIARTEGQQRHSLTYDHADRLVSVTEPSTKLAVTCSYDAFGRRFVMTEGGRKIRFVDDGWRCVEEIDPSGKSLAVYTHGAGGDGLVHVLRGGKHHFACADDLGSIAALLDAKGQLVERYVYDDFGEPAILDAKGKTLAESRSINPFRFTGHRYDAPSGLYYCRTRYLDPRAGRFTTRDAVGIWKDAVNLGNGFAYAGNNPTSFVDRMGESVERTISCNGPWPGPANVKVEYEGCSSNRRQLLDSPVCRAFRASAQSRRDVLNVWTQDFTGVPIPGTGITRSRLQKWFGGPDNATSTYSKSVIGTNFDYVFDAINGDDFDIDCETGCDSGVNAYVNGGGSDVNLCSRFFTVGFTRSKQAAILVHELTHAYADTDDNFYYPNDGSNLPWNLFIETPMLRETADVYEQFVLEFYT